MKRVWLLLCGLILFCLCACHAEQADKSAPEKRLPPDRELTMEEALEYATPLATSALADEMTEDLELAKETYEGYYYLMNFVVVGNDPDEDYVWSRLHAPIPTLYNKNVDFLLYLPEEERTGVEYGDVVQLVGKISFIGVSKKLNRTATMMELTDAHLVTKTFQVTGKVTKKYTNYKGENRLILVDESDSVFPDSEIGIHWQPGGDFAVGDTVTATGTLVDHIRHDSIGGSALHAWLFAMDETESVELVNP